MCRLLIGTSNAIRAYHRCNDLHDLLDHLEHECGGHGNGVAMHRNGALIETHKGVDLPTADIANTLVHCGKLYDTAIFHTRIASVSDVSDSNCHPYIHGNDALAMNGTLSEFRDVAQALQITDTEVAFNLVRGLTLKKTIAALSVLNAVFVGISEGKPYALRNGGALKEWRPKRMGAKDFLFASSFPRGTACVIDLPHSFVFANGERTKAAHTEPGYYFNNATSGYRYPTYSDIPKISRQTQENTYDIGYDEGYAAGFEDGLAEATTKETIFR